MPYLYGSLPIGMTALKSLTLQHPDYNSGTAATVSIISSADYVGFETARTLFHNAIYGATSGDLSLSWSETNGYCTFTSAGDKTWTIWGFPARGFFGFTEYPNNYDAIGGVPFGAMYLEGLSVDNIEIPTSEENRELAGDGYAFIKGTILNCTGYFQVGKTRASRKVSGGAGTSLDWVAYKGVVTVQPNPADATAWSISNMDGKITDGKLIGYTMTAQETFVGTKVWEIKMKLQV